MIYLLLSIIVSSFLFVIFKLFEVYKINTLQAIITNYIVAFTIGVFSSEATISLSEVPEQSWFLGTLLLGFLFVLVFIVMALTAQKNGLSVASVAGKMSLIIPIIFGVFMYNESLGFFKIIGFILALIAVYLTSVKDDITKQDSYLIYPILLFLGSGLIDTSLKYLETTYVQKGAVPLFSATIFFFAFIFGIIIFTYKRFTEKVKFSFKNVVAGIVLGVPNYYSIVFILKALKTTDVESSIIFTVNNVATVLLTTILGLLIFREKPLSKNWIGIIIAIISIVLVTIP